MATNILTDITSTTTDTFTGSFTDIDELSHAPTVAGTASVCLMIAQVPFDLIGDETAEVRFTVDGSPVGPTLTAFQDTTNEGNSCTIIHAVTGLSAAVHTFAVQAANITGTPSVSITRARTFQVIEFTEGATLLVDLNSSPSQAADGTWTNITGLSEAQTPTASSLHLFIANVQCVLETDSGADIRFAVDGVTGGPVLSLQTDTSLEGDGVCMTWFETGLAASSQTFSVQIIDRLNTLQIEPTNWESTFQVIEFTAAAQASMLSDIEITSADTFVAEALEVMTGMTTTKTPVDTNSVMLLTSNLNILGISGDDRSCESQLYFGALEGAIQVQYTDAQNRVVGTCLMRAKTGITASTAFETHVRDIGTSLAATDTTRERTQQLVEFSAGGVAITAMGAGEFSDKDTGLTTTCTGAEAVQGTGKLEVSDNATYGSGNVVAQTVTSWADTSVGFTAVLGAMAPGTPRYGWLTNDSAERNSTGFQVQMHRAHAFVISASSFITASGEVTTSQLAAPASGSAFGGGQAADDENPLDTTDVAEDEHFEDELCIKATANANDALYDFRVLVASAAADTITVTPQWTVVTVSHEYLISHINRIKRRRLKRM